MTIRTSLLTMATVFISIGAFQSNVAAQNLQDRMFDLRALSDVGANEIEQIARQAERGDARAQRRLGMLYLTGNDPTVRGPTFDVARNPAEAAKWFRMAAEQGDPISQLRLGLLYYDGDGVTRDFAEAAKWLRGPAEEGDVNAQTFLGSVYTRTGANWELNYTEAVKWFEMAADQGSEGAIVSLAGLYNNGLGVELDFERAMDLYREGSDNSTAQFNIGIMYRRGDGVDADLEEAAEWIERAADQGHPLAQYEIGQIYHEGEGVEQDDVRAHMWVDLATESAQGVELQNRIEMRNTIAAGMTPDDIQEANRRRREWQPRSR